MSAKSDAIKQLGRIEDYIGLDALNKERDVARSEYNTTLDSLRNEYNNLLSYIASKRSTNLQDFTAGRNTVADNAFMANRPNLATQYSRGVGNSSAGQLSNVFNRMETGRQNSNLANTFYNTENSINTTQDRGTASYNLNVDTANNTLNSVLAGISSREANRRNDYNTAVANLAETIQARLDANANAKAARDLQKQLAEDSLYAEARDRAYNAIGGIGNNDYTVDQYNKAVDAIRLILGDRIGTDDASIMNYLEKYGITKPVVVTNDKPKDNKDSKTKTTKKSTLLDWFTTLLPIRTKDWFV